MRNFNARQSVHLGAQRIEIVGHRTPLRRAVIQSVDVFSQVFAAGQRTHIPGDVLARAAHAGQLTVELVVVLQMVEQQTAHLGNKRRSKMLAGFEEVSDLAEDPRTALRAAGIDADLNTLLCFALGFAFRMLAIRLGWKLPTFSYQQRWD